MNRIIDISGFVYSGKSSVSDILREVEGIYVPRVEEEFDLLRIPGGLIDLKNAVEDWSPTRVNAAYKKFASTAAAVGKSLPFYKKFFNDSWAYENRYPGYFEALDKFLKGIVDVNWLAPWPHENLNDRALKIFIRKIMWRFGFMTQREVALISKEHFLRNAQCFTEELLWSGIDCSRFQSLVVHNSLEPFNPARNLVLYKNAKSIVVSRDPRDIFAAAQFMYPGQKDFLNRYLRICGAHDVNIFIKRFKIYNSNVCLDKDVLRISYEDIVRKYDQSVDEIFSFLNIDPSRHLSRRASFNPDVSKKNIEIWKDFRYKKWWPDFIKIEESCREYLS
jgi:hypothetical protein